MDAIKIVSMPFGALDRPALGASLLAASLARIGVACEVDYLCFDFAERIGVELYRWVHAELPYTAFAGDQCFAEALYGAAADTAGFERDVLVGTWRMDSAALERLAAVRRAATAFVDEVAASTDWSRYEVVGFTSTFEQNLASLALARRLKERHPDVPIVFGGANWEGEMGIALHESFPWVDFACSGEAEQSFPALCRALASGNAPGRGGPPIPGVIHRERGGSVLPAPPERAPNLDALPPPDFASYFARLERSHLRVDVEPMLLFETARGCWWGARSHCTFCGLNGESLAFRSKSPERVLREFGDLVDRWPCDQVAVVDNILDMRYFDSVLPALAQRESGPRLFWETKANLTEAQVRKLAAAGVHRIQPGIESLSDGVLHRMRKGTTGLRNIQLLKWCRKHGVGVDWNVLLGFPGETAAEREEELARLRAIRHLDPPGACAPIRIDRFSPYFERPAEFGLRSLRPLAAYRWTYPFDDEVRRRIAYSFEFDYEPDRRPPAEVAQRVSALVDAWRREDEPTGLWCRAQPETDQLEIVDARGTGEVVHAWLRGWRRRAFEAIDAMNTVDRVAATVHVAPERVQRFFDALVRRAWALTDGRRYLGLAVATSEEAGMQPGRQLLQTPVSPRS